MYFLRSRGKIKLSRVLFLLLVILLILNANRIGRALYPFPYRETIFYYAREYRLDPYLLAAVIKAESNFNPEAVSKKGARGLMQVMPETGKWVAENIGLAGYHPDRLYNPRINICIGAWYMADLYREYNDTILVLAAYNGGRGNVDKWLAKTQWREDPGKIEQIPFPETKLFIRKVTWNYKVYRYLYGS